MIDHKYLAPAFSKTCRNAFTRSLFALLVALLFCVCSQPVSAQSQTQTVVQKYGRLRVQGNKIVDQTGAPVQLRGMSLYWSQWVPKYWTFNTMKWLRDDWKVTVIRAAMAVNSGGFATNPTVERNKVIAVVDACIQLGIYVVIDYHDHTASDNTAMAKAFFADMAQRYGKSPNVMFETFNEPLNVSWASVLKPYHQAVIASIRPSAPDSIIICGTRNWSQEVDEAAANPISGSNIAYTLHFYANTHKQSLRDKAQSAMNRGAALFVTEYGTTDASGKGTVNPGETQTWWNFLDQNKVSYCNWSVADIPESSAALNAGASPDGGWSTSQIKQSGLLVRDMLRAKAPVLTGGGTGGGTGGSTTVAAGTYSLRNRASGKMLDSLGLTANGASVGQWTDGSSNNQRWVLSYTGTFAKLTCVTGNRVLDSVNQTLDNTPVGLWDNGTSFNQQWTLTSVSGGFFTITNRTNGKNLDSGGATTDGSIMKFFAPSTSFNQQWQFVAP